MFRSCVLLTLGALVAASGFCFGADAQTKVITRADSQVTSPGESRLLEEVGRRENKLSKQRFNLVQYVGPDESMPIELFVLQSNAEYVISLWFETTQNSFEVDLRDSAGNSLASSQGWRAEQHLEQTLLAGKYTLSVRPIGGARVHGLIGIKGPAVSRCKIDRTRLTEQPADPEHGYWWPYLLVTPAPLGSDAPPAPSASTLFVAPNNPGAATDDVDLLRASAICELGYGRNAGTLAIADSLGTPILVPLFPRPDLPAELSNLQLQALARASLDERLEPRLKRVDLQLIAMIDAAREKLLAMGQPVRKRVLMAGFSTSGAFTNRLTVLHPERVLAAAAGSPGGWPIAPVTVDQGDELRYPVGIADVKDLTGQAIDLDMLRCVRLLFLLGDIDNNDSVGKRDSFSDADSTLINRRFGDTLVARWWPAQRLYNVAGLKRTEFKLYHGVGHEMTPEMWNDILSAFRTALSTP